MRTTISLPFAAAVLSAALAICSPVAAQDASKTAPAAAKGDAPKPIIASEPTVTTALYGSWTLRCMQLPPSQGTEGKTARPAAQSCEIIQSVQLQGQAQPIAQIALGRLPNDKDFTLTALLPVNIAIPGAVQIFGNGKSDAEAKSMLTLAWHKCSAGACVATAKPDAATLAIFRKEEAGQLRFVDASGKVLGIPVSWSGFEQAIDALAKKD
ncbi:hypothetical protein RU07_07425 [Agrobacterium tumefaciens]|uniref:Invasion protein n=1 Tax=Agrobacterium tumefaciens TaxID=358 RepID=A0A0D0L286_AGRTU|nr:hypothetical protein RU07_07425 [Agrobacterium tumefaciens]